MLINQKQDSCIISRTKTSRLMSLFSSNRLNTTIISDGCGFSSPGCASTLRGSSRLSKTTKKLKKGRSSWSSGLLRSEKQAQMQMNWAMCWRTQDSVSVTYLNNIFRTPCITVLWDAIVWVSISREETFRRFRVLSQASPDWSQSGLRPLWARYQLALRSRAAKQPHRRSPAQRSDF